MPTEKVLSTDIISQIHVTTGFPKYQIKEVVDNYFNCVEEAIINKKSVSVPKVGILYPSIKPGKNVVKINKFKKKGAELMYMAPRWVCRFKVKPSFAKLLLNEVPTKEEVDNIYK